jgi:type VI secretion system protein ImpL
MKRLFLALGSPLFALLKHPGLVVEIGAVFLIALVWFAGPLVGFDSIAGRVQIIIGIGLLRAAVHVVQYLLVQRRGAKLEESLRQEGARQVGNARPDRKEEIDAVRLQFEKGITALKESKLSKGLSGKAALYALPWYMFIGPPASGKSTALRHSGLQFPSLSGSGQGLQGVGGTRNCDWWFTNEGVLLDTAGRYVTHEEDQAEWVAFLDLLKKYRKQNSINGVIATIAIPDLMQASEEEVEAHAKQIRTRIDELITRLGIVFPVYVMFTKCDLVQGFTEFFDELNSSERDRVWGCTFPKVPPTNDPPAIRFRNEFDGLLSALQARRLTRLVNTRGSHKVTIFGFPMQMASTRDRLTKFVEVLFQANPYQENPLLRGFYFTSGTQEGTPIDRILGAVGRASGLSDVSLASYLPTESKSYFLKNLFTEIIFPDRQLVTPSSTIYRQRGYLRIGAVVMSVFFVLLAVIGLAVSFIGNKRILSETLSSALNAPSGGLDDSHLEENVRFIGLLGRQFEDILMYQRDGVPLRLAGFYQGPRIHEVVQELYLRQFTRQFLSVTKRDMEGELGQFTIVEGGGGTEQHNEYDDYYSLLKAYIMLGDPIHLKPSYLNRWLNDYWQDKLKQLVHEREISQDVLDMIRQQMDLYSQYLARDAGSRLALNVRLVQEVQQKLRQVPRVQRIYSMSRREAQDLVKPFSLESVLQGSHQGSLVSDYTIPGVYTLVGWKGPFQESVAKVLMEAATEGWVIGEPEVEPAQLDKGIKRLYFQDYIRHWREFIRSLRIRQAVTPANSEEVLGLLSQADSPLSRVFEAVDQNTHPEPAAMGQLQESMTSVFEKIKKGLGIEGVPSGPLPTPRDTEELMRRLGDPNDFSGSVSRRFQSIHYLITVAKDSKEEAPLIRYLTELRKVHQTLRPILRAESPPSDTKAMAKSIVSGEPNDVFQAMKSTDTILQNLDPESIEAVSPLLVEPWMIAVRGVLERAKAEASKRWEADVYPACQRNVEGRFPFRTGGVDAPLSDLTDLFHPDSGLLWRYYQAELKPFINEGAERWEPRQWSGVGLTLSDEFLSSLQHARLLSESLFVKGSAEVGAVFELYPYPPQGGVSKSVSEIRLDIDGQALRYRMEPQEWHEMKWPGPTPATGAALQVQVGTAWVTKEYKDWWGLFRLIQAGHLMPGAGDTQYRVRWELPTADGRPVQVQYDIRARGYKNPFRPGMFEQVRCVEHL